MNVYPKVTQDNSFRKRNKEGIWPGLFPSREMSRYFYIPLDFHLIPLGIKQKVVQ
jgi:hypothetical protein